MDIKTLNITKFDRYSIIIVFINREIVNIFNIIVFMYHEIVNIFKPLRNRK